MRHNTRGYRTEIYNSTLDLPAAGLPKPGPVPATNASSLASDHFLIFGDFDLGGPEPAPVLSWPVAADIAAGQSLGDSLLTGGAAAVPGTFAFAAPETVHTPGTAAWDVVFTPQNQLDYTAVTNAMFVTVIGSQTPTPFGLGNNVSVKVG